MGRRHWVLTCLWVEQRLVILGHVLGAVRPDQALEKIVTVETLQPPTHHRASPGLWGGGPVSGEGTPSSLTWASQSTADSPGVLKDSKKNKGLSGAAVYSDSSHNAPKNPYCSCSGHRAVAGDPPLTHLTARGWEGLPGVQLGLADYENNFVGPMHCFAYIFTIFWWRIGHQDTPLWTGGSPWFVW